MFGKPVRDIFGRKLGSAIGLIYNMDGGLGAVGVDMGAGDFVQYPGSRVVVDGEGFVIVPEWKDAAQAVRAERDRLQRRSRFLSEANGTSEISESIAREMENRLDSVRKSHEIVVHQIRVRKEELGIDDDELDTFLASMRLQLGSGEIDESSYRLTSDFCLSCKQANKQESNELDEILEIMSDGPINVPVEERPAEATELLGPSEDDVISDAPIHVPIEGAPQGTLEPVGLGDEEDAITEVSMSLKELRTRFP